VVVGGGAAGCVVAATLSGHPGRDVLLLEAGADHGDVPVLRDVGPYFDDPSRMRTDMVVRRRGLIPEPYRQGSGLGGSSLINGTVVTSPDRAPESLPLEAPWAHGAVATALLAADGEARPVGLVRRRRARRTAADIFLRPHLDRPNLTVGCDAQVERVLLDGHRAVGVELTSGATVDADRVVMCAGAVHTPAILLRGGVRTPGIGEGVRDHPAFTLTLRLFDFAVDASSPTISVAATHLRHQVIALDHLPDDARFGALAVGLLQPRSEGRISLDDHGNVLVELRQLDHADDRDGLVDAVATTIRRLDDPAWHSVVAEVLVDDQGTPVERVVDDRLDEWVVAHAGGHHHVSASCRDGVLTDDRVVRGHEALYVADASALPDVPAIDPYVAVIAQAERFASGWTGAG
jgi:choline dehydrogenase-like flavoprotein